MSSWLYSGRPLLDVPKLIILTVFQGDYGGPLVARVSGKWFLVGMPSWGRGCGMAFFPSIFTRISAVSGWIAPIFNGEDPGG